MQGHRKGKFMVFRDEQVWCRLPGAYDVWSWSCTQQGFYDLRMLAIRLKDGQLLIWSPIASASEEALAALDKLGKVGAMVEPNHFHHLGVEPFRKRYPRAALVAHDPAIPRLQRVTRSEFQSLSALQPLLPDGLHLAGPEGLKQGETWLWSERRGSDPGFLVVGDSYLNMTSPKNFLVDKAFRMTGSYPGLKLTKVFRFVAFADQVRFRTWVDDFQRRHQPTVLIPSHGDLYESPSLGQELVSLI
jgi:hypothetical protein